MSTTSESADSVSARPYRLIIRREGGVEKQIELQSTSPSELWGELQGIARQFARLCVDANLLVLDQSDQIVIRTGERSLTQRAVSS
jgi:hypothetical protein